MKDFGSLDGRFVEIQQYRGYRDFEPAGLDDVVNGVRRVTLCAPTTGHDSDYVTLDNYDTEKVDRETALRVIQTGGRN